MECLDSYKRFYTDAEASSAYGGPLSAQQSFARLKSDLGSWHLQGFGVWAIKHQDKFVGTCGFWQGDGWPCELTWWLLPEARGQGIAYEASIAAIKHAYAVFNWQAVHSYAEDDNIAAVGLLKKLGGSVIERRIFPDGKTRDFYHIPRPV